MDFVNRCHKDIRLGNTLFFKKFGEEKKQLIFNSFFIYIFSIKVK